MTLVTESLSNNVVANAKSQVEQTWPPVGSLGPVLHRALVAQHAFLAVTGYLKVDRLSDTEARQLVIAVWEKLSDHG